MDDLTDWLIAREDSIEFNLERDDKRMMCTEQERETCNVEKMGCAGCYYNKSIEEGEYVRTKNGIIGIFDRYSSRKENSLYKSPFNCFIKIGKRKTPLQCCEDYIVKHSKIISEVVEVGDYVNGKLIHKIDKGPNYCYLFYGNCKTFVSYQIKTILTHEQFEQNSYKV